MGIFDKLRFRKKDEEPDFDALTEQESQFGKPVQGDLGLDEQNSFGAERDQTQQSQARYGFEHRRMEPSPPLESAGVTMQNRDLELLNSKLETIKAILNSVDQRVANIERSVGVGQKRERLW